MSRTPRRKRVNDPLATEAKSVDQYSQADVAANDIEQSANSVRMQVRGQSAIGVAGHMLGNATGDFSRVTNIHQVVQYFSSHESDQAPLAEAEIDAAISHYTERLRQTYGRLDLEVLIPMGEGEHPQVGLREVFVPPVLRPDPPRVELPPELHKRLLESGEILPDETLPPGVGEETVERVRQAYRERPPIGLLEAISSPQARRTVLLGDPGSGKSTLARYIALALTSTDPTGPLSQLTGWLPVVIELRRYAEAEWRERTFEEFLDHLSSMEQMCVPRQVLEACLRGGRAIVVFDGLDELFDPSVRAEVSRRIAAFAAKYEDARVIVTSRVIGYQRGTLDAAGFRHFMIQDLSERQIKQFVQLWYDAVCPHAPDLGDRLCKRIIDAVTHSRPVRELAGNPLLLTILAIIGRRKELPRDRQGVYEHAVKVLIAHWDEDAKHLKPSPDAGVIALLDDRDRHELLRLLARKMQEGSGGIAGNHIHGTELEATFKEYLGDVWELPALQATAVARAMKRQLQERNFILSRFGGEVYGFVHRAFLEYLAAADIAHRYNQREWNEEELIDEVFAHRAQDASWHEVLLLLVGQVDERVAARAIDKFVSMHHVVDRDTQMLVLAIRALAEVRKIGLLSEQSRTVVDELIEHLEESHASASIKGAIPALAAFGQHWSGRRRYLRWFHIRGQFHERNSEAAAVACALYHSEGIPRVLALHSTSPFVRGEMLEKLAVGWPESAGLYEFLRGRAVSDVDKVPRGMALAALARQWSDRTDVLEFIRDRAQSDEEWWARDDALEALAEHWAGAAETRDLLSVRAVEDPDDYPRGTALRILAERWAEDPDTLALLKGRAIDDEHENPRETALERLGDHWINHPGVREIFVHSASQDLHEDPRVIALDVLAEHFHDLETRDLLKRCAVDDLHEIVRETALEALAEHWADDPGTRDLIRARAVDDLHEFPRRAALRLLASHWADDPETHDLVRSRAIDDLHETPRGAALRFLVEHWADDPETRDLVRSRVIDDLHEIPRGIALRILVEFWHDDPETYTLVQSCATTDFHEFFRTSALRLLVEYWSDERVTRDLLVARASKDSSPLLRGRSIMYLAEYWHSDTEIRDLLETRAIVDPDQEVRGSALGALVRYWPGEAKIQQTVLSTVTNDTSPEFRAESLQWWAWNNSGEAVADMMLSRAVADPSPIVRTAAARVLAFAWPANQATISLLRELASKDVDPGVREAASVALLAAECLIPFQAELQ
ncbi:HEAT repeat domain-containing protein [Streptomyces sasae]|uniref:HEAT repeat domain-containing protein n=1 Tax=Streptomyces sasae TaxID=1266772 RepID=UPI00292D6334|nr:HEAT repeat domain-containing protein [Streptomyces sasae]